MSRTTSRTMVEAPQAWAQEHFGGAELGDLRLSKRAVKVAAAMAGDPAGSIPRQGGCWKHAKGAYRLFDHDRVTFESLCASHWGLTRREAGRCATVLLIQDTTWLDYSDHPATAALGWQSRNANKGRPRGGSGLFLHNVLAVQPTTTPDGRRAGRVLGLAWGKLWARTGERPLNADQKARSRRRGGDDLESLRWREAITQVGSPPPGVRWIHVGDREADIFELYEQCKQAGVGFTIRQRHDRNALVGHDTPDTLGLQSRKGTSLLSLCREMPTLGTTKVWVPARGGRRGRWAELEVSGGPVTVYSPQLSRTGVAMRLFLVRAHEPNPPQGHKALEWVILTDRPVESLEHALEVTGWYALRWLIEELFHCLKTGCDVEGRQLESGDRLAPLIGMCCVVAARLLALRCDSRLTPDRPAVECVEPELVATLARLIDADPHTLSVGRFFVEVAKRGGHLARKPDGPPGWKTLWHGWQKLTLIHLGYQMAKEGKGCG